MHGAAQRVDNCEQHLEFFMTAMVSLTIVFGLRPKTRADHGHPKRD